jgi:hypothetical protein
MVRDFTIKHMDSWLVTDNLLWEMKDGSSGEETKKDLRSRGLCLVPVSCMLDVGVDAGPADYWTAAPPFGMGFNR